MGGANGDSSHAGAAASRISLAGTSAGDDLGLSLVAIKAYSPQEGGIGKAKYLDVGPY